MRGFSLLEIVLCCALLTILTAVLCLAWVRGARTWMYTTRLTTRISELRIARSRIERELAPSSALGLDTQTTVLTFPSGYGLRGTPEAETFFRRPGTINPQWRKYAVYWWVASEGVLYFREVPIPGGNPAESQTTRLSLADLGSGVQALPFYATGGEKLAEKVSDFVVDVQNVTVTLQLECSDTYNSTNLRKQRIQSTTLLRN